MGAKLAGGAAVVVATLLSVAGCGGQRVRCTSDRDCGISEGGVCDGADLAGETCGSRGLGEGVLGCAGDCLTYDEARCTGCGDGACAEGECASCPADCREDACGDGCCGGTEDACTCAADCEPFCGDGCCSESEDVGSCTDDCFV